MNEPEHTCRKYQLLCGFHTSSSLASLRLCFANVAFSFIMFMVNTGSQQSGIAPELNQSHLYAICRCGQSGKFIDLLARCCFSLGRPGVQSEVCSVVISSVIKEAKRQAVRLFKSRITHIIQTKIKLIKKNVF